jgi:hypothetical protein
MDENTKECPKCGRLLPLADFGVRTNGKVQHWCRACHCRYQREYYERRKDYYLKLQNERVERNRRAIREAKNVPCADCGRRYPHYVMDFDHRPGEKKCFNVSVAAGQPRLSWQRMLAEIAKCDVVCANCHRERTHRRMLEGRENAWKWRAKWGRKRKIDLRSLL